MQTEQAANKIAILAKEGDARFLEIGKILRVFYESLSGADGPKTEALKDLLKGTKIARRRALYWMEFDRVYGDLGVLRERLAAIGSIKLSLVAGEVDIDTIDALLNFIEPRTTDNIRAFLKNQEPPAHVLRFKLSDKQYSVIAGTLLANGAYLTSDAGLANKELALMKICPTVRKAWDTGII